MQSPSERHRQEYTARIHRVQDHIERHLGEELSLEGLARVACFSPFHFHRVFGAVTGESLHQFILRLRLAKAASQLLQNPTKSVTEIALDCGFSGSAPFARAFRGAFSMSASQWRAAGHSSYMGGSPNPTHAPDGSQEPGPCALLPAKAASEVHVQVCEAMTVAYIRHAGPYAGDAGLFERLFRQLMRWAGPRDLIHFPDTKMMTIYHDPPGITEDNRLRISVCVQVPTTTRPEGEVGVMQVPEGRFAFAHYLLNTQEYGAAWNWVFGHWLPASGYQCDDGPCYELYLGEPDPVSQLHAVDIVLPVRPL